LDHEEAGRLMYSACSALAADFDCPLTLDQLREWKVTAEYVPATGVDPIEGPWFIDHQTNAVHAATETHWYGSEANGIRDVIGISAHHVRLAYDVRSRTAVGFDTFLHEAAHIHNARRGFFDNVHPRFITTCSGKEIDFEEHIDHRWCPGGQCSLVEIDLRQPVIPTVDYPVLSPNSVNSMHVAVASTPLK